MKSFKSIITFFLLFNFLTSCDLLDDLDNNEIIIDNGEGITIEFLEGLNDDDRFQLSKNSDGYYELTLDSNKNQTTQRITGRLLRDGNPLWDDLWSGPGPKKVEFSSNLYWWLKQGDTVANITKTYINYFTGQITYVNLPPIINWKDYIVPTINSSGYSDSETGLFNTVIGPVWEMKGDTMKIVVQHTHSITSKEEGSIFFSTLGNKVFKDSTYIILK